MKPITKKISPHTVIYRHRKENLKKCSLRGLESREDMTFYTYPQEKLPPLAGAILLSVGAPELTVNDCGRTLLVLDGTWRYAQKMAENGIADEEYLYRSLPKEWKTAYPRKQEDCPDPGAGLASVEAIFIAYHILGWDTAGILDKYHWRDEFLKLNSSLL